MDRPAGIRISEESRFRELEDEYLQKQARIWLGEVLRRRLDEEQTLSDILAYGDVLFDVSYVLWRMLIEKGVEVEDLRIFSRTRKSKKHSGKYTPYSNVDAFLKICKVMGLNGVDLFSPSDVVERRDTRKVCLCIRSLSKKARSVDVNVPDFDVVTCTMTMQTNMIGCIRRSLEFSQCGSVCSDSYSSCIDSDPVSIKTKSTASLESSYECHSEESDDADSSVSVGYYRPFSKIQSNAALFRKSGSLSSLESFSLSKNTNLEEALAHFGVCNHDMGTHEFTSSPLVDSSFSLVDISAMSCFGNQQNQVDSEYHRGNLTVNHRNDDQTVLANGVHDLSVCASMEELYVDKSTPKNPKADSSSPVSGLECHGYCYSCGEDRSNYADMLNEGPLSIQMHDEGLLCYNLSCPRNSCNQCTSVHNFNLDYNTRNEDDQGHVESQFSSVLDPVPDLVNTCGKVHNNSCDARSELIVYSDRLKPKMRNEGTGVYVSCHDYQCYESGGDNETSDCNIHLSSQKTSDYGDGESESLYNLEDWSADNEDLENVHLSIIEKFLTTTVCSEPEQSFCGEKCDESDCWNLDIGVNDVDMKPILPIGSCERFLHFVDGSSCDTKFIEDLSLAGGDEDKGVLEFSYHEDQANFVEGTKQTTYGTESPCEQEASDNLIQRSTNDREFDAVKFPLSHTPVTFDADRDVEECAEAKLIEAKGLLREDHEAEKLNQSKTSKAPILKTIMGGAAVLGLGVLAIFLNARMAEKPKSKNADSEPSRMSGKNKLSSPTSTNGMAKKGVYAAGKLKFS